jgi:hypothetical protein
MPISRLQPFATEIPARRTTIAFDVFITLTHSEFEQQRVQRAGGRRNCEQDCGKDKWSGQGDRGALHSVYGGPIWMVRRG